MSEILKISLLILLDGASSKSTNFMFKQCVSHALILLFNHKIHSYFGTLSITNQILIKGISNNVVTDKFTLKY